MTNFSDTIALRRALMAAAHAFYSQGWMVGTAGNLSARLADGSIWITASGRPKGSLTIEDFVQISAAGDVIERSHPDRKPSAETVIHQTLYQLFPTACVCYHVHSIEANLVSQFPSGNAVLLPPLEMLKGLGVPEESPDCEMPVFANHGQVARIAADIRDRFQATPPQVPALLIRHHGVTVWATSLESAQNYVEIVEYLFRYMVAARQLGLLPSASRDA